MLTLFSVPRPFVGHYDIIQRNAIKSWTMLRPLPEIILLGTDEGTAEVAEEFGVRHVPGIDYGDSNSPRLDSMHREVEREAQNPLLCIVNADIILMNDFIQAVERVSQRSRKFVMMGQRHNLDVSRPMEFGPNWIAELRSQVEETGSLGARTGEDYIVFPKDFFGYIPPLDVGHSYTDGWLLYEGRRRKLDLIDTTSVVMAVHQNHNYNHIQKSTQGFVNDPQTIRNELLSGGPSHMLIVKDRTHILTVKGEKPARDVWRVFRFVRTAILLHPTMPMPLRIFFKGLNHIINGVRQVAIWVRLRDHYKGPRYG